MKHAHGQRSQPGLHPCAGLGHLIALALNEGCPVAARDQRRRIQMPCPLFQLAEVGEHDSKGFHGVSRFYANTTREIGTDQRDGPKKNVPAAAFPMPPREKFHGFLSKGFGPNAPMGADGNGQVGSSTM